MNHLRKEWREFVAAKLDLHTSVLVTVLRGLAMQPYPPEVASLDFELFPDGFTEGFPARAFFVDSENTEVFVEENGRFRYPSTVDPELLDIAHIYSADEEEAFLDREGAMEIEDELWELATTVFFDWFERCWIDAGGSDFPLRATIMPHDDPGSGRTLPSR